MNPSTTRRAAMVCAGLAAAVTLAGCAGTDNGARFMPASSSASSSSQPATTSQPSANSQPAATDIGVDIMFTQMTIMHHRQAVEMANLAATRAADPRVKKLASQIKAAQAPEIATMTKWLTAHGEAPMLSGADDMGGMDHGMPGMVSKTDMAKLQAASGKTFDRQFLQLMTAHHKGAIEMARTERIQGADPEAKALAARIIQTQQPEIDIMQKLLAQP